MRPRWAPQSSKLSILLPRDGRFDSDTFPQMMKVLFTVAVLATVLTAQSAKLFWDGYDWQQVDRLTQEYPEYRLPFKRAYVRGLLDGKLYYYLQASAQDSFQAEVVFRDYLNRFSIDELVRGTDQFYRDPANLYLPVVNALAITSLRAMGFPDSVVTGYDRATRHWINLLTTQINVQVPVTLEGISRPAAPIPPPPWELPAPAKRPWDWTDPVEAILP